MGLFQKNWNKEGKGVEKGAAQGSPWVLYWKLFFRNFMKMCGYGAVYFLVALPLVCLAVYLVVAVFDPETYLAYLNEIIQSGEGAVVPEGTTVVNSSLLLLVMYITVFTPPWISVPLVILSALAIGPMTCGMVYCMRNHGRQEHAWFTDLFTRAWRNKWQGLFFGLLDVLVMVSLCAYLFMPGTMGMSPAVYTYCRYMGIAIFLIYQVMRWYIYQMIVTFTLKIKVLFKNSWMFVVLGWKRNLVALLGSAVLIAAFLLLPTFYPMLMPLAVILMMTVFWSMLWFLQVFATYPVMHHYMVAPALEDMRKAEAKKRREERAKARAEGRVPEGGEEDGEDEELSDDIQEDEEEEEDDSILDD